MRVTVGIVVGAVVALALCRCAGVAAGTSASERAALQDLYAATNGPAWVGVVIGWRSTSLDPCDTPWTGVTCSENGVT
jgi:hypothetical protein